MSTTTVKDRDELLDLIDALTEVGCDQVAICGRARYDSVRLLACTDPDAAWWWMNDTSGENSEYSRHQRVDDMLVPNPTAVMFPDVFTTALEPGGSES